MRNNDHNSHEEFRPRLTALAYRMLGTTADAEDAVQEAFLRLHSADETPDSIEGWLFRVTTRLCIDRKRRASKMQYVGDWLPEPVPDAGFKSPGELTDSLSTAFMVLLEALTPIERAVSLLKDIFAYDFDEISEIVGKTETNARQIVVRANRTTCHCHHQLSPSRR